MHGFIIFVPSKFKTPHPITMGKQTAFPVKITGFICENLRLNLRQSAGKCILLRPQRKETQQCFR